MKSKVMQSMGPNRVHGKAKASPPRSGMTVRPKQSGMTSPKTDGGGGMGNELSAMHRQIFGK